jgi:LysM repeat protein
MKTIFSHILNKSVLRIGGIGLSVLMALSMMAAALPQPALAAASTPTCAYTYTVKSGDTKGMIADKYGLKWWEIAKANNLHPTAKPVVGAKLCIPTKDWASSATTGTMTATAAGKRLSVKMSGFSTAGVWNVRVKDDQAGIDAFYKVGRITAPAKGSVTKGFNLPESLLKTPKLTVCTTNADSSVDICTHIVHVIK